MPEPPMSQDEYASHDGLICPFCRSTNIDGQDEHNWCNECKRCWEDEVGVVGYTPIEDDD